MPLYEYECDACGQRFELIRKFSDPPVEVCTLCGKGPVNRLQSSPAIQFKGSGWYITDYAKKREGDKKGEGGKGEGGKGEGGSTDKTATEKTQDAKSDAAAANKRSKSDGKSDTPGKSDVPAKSDAPAKSSGSSSPAGSKD